MELKQIYEQMQGDYDSVLERLGKEDRVKRFLFMLADKEMDQLIMDAYQEKDYERLFREAHSLKGICANLSLDKLEHSTSALVEELRDGEPKIDITAHIQAMKEDYDMTIAAINSLER